MTFPTLIPDLFKLLDDDGQWVANVTLNLDEATTQVWAFLGKRGTGKTYGAGAFVERMLEHDIQVVVVDVVGTWFGLRTGRDGVAPGFAIPILGGEHGDLEIVPEAGAVVAKMLVDTGSSAVLDLSNLRKGARQRFLTEWAEDFFHAKKTARSPVHIVIEEAHTVIPQRAMKGQERMLGAMEDLVRLGRNYGIGVSMIDQRPQSVNKDALNQAEVLCAFQLVGAQERDAVRRWAEAKEQPDIKRALAGLASLPQGECILWSPEWLKLCRRVKVGPKATLDASSTPVAGTATGPRALMREIDLDELRSAMAAAADKPGLRAALKSKRGIAGFAEQVEAAPADGTGRTVWKEDYEVLAGKYAATAQNATDLQIRLIAVSGECQAWRERCNALEAQERDLVVGIRRATELIGTARATLQDAALVLDRLELAPDLPPRPENRIAAPGLAAKLDTLTERAKNTGWRQVSDTVYVRDSQGEPMSKMARAFLTALAQSGPLTRKQLHTLTGYRQSGDTTLTIAAMLRRDLAISGNFGNGGRPAQLSITGAGLAALGNYEKLPTGRALWRQLIDETSKLSKMERIFLTILGRVTGLDGELTAETRCVWKRKDVVAKAGYKQSGDTSVALAKLVTLGYAENTKGGIWLADMLCDLPVARKE